MSTPIFLSEAVALEIRNIMRSLQPGMKVRLSGEEGVINFISDEYITITLHQWEDEDTLHGYQQTNVLVYPNEWEDMEIEDAHFYNKKNYTILVLEAQSIDLLRILQNSRPLNPYLKLKLH